MSHCSSCGYSLMICPDCGKVGCDNSNCRNNISKEGLGHRCGVCFANLKRLVEYQSEKRKMKEMEDWKKETESSSTSNRSPEPTYISRGEPTVFREFLDLAFISAIVAFVAFITIWVFVNVKFAFGCSVAIWAIMTGYMSWRWFKPKPIRQRKPGRGGGKY